MMAAGELVRGLHEKETGRTNKEQMCMKGKDQRRTLEIYRELFSFLENLKSIYLLT